MAFTCSHREVAEATVEYTAASERAGRERTVAPWNCYWEGQEGESQEPWRCDCAQKTHSSKRSGRRHPTVRQSGSRGEPVRLWVILFLDFRSLFNVLPLLS